MGIPRLHLVLGVVVILLKRMYDDRLYSLCVSRKGRIYSFVFFQHRGLGGLLSTRLDTPLFALFFTTSLGSWTLSSRLSSLPPFFLIVEFFITPLTLFALFYTCRMYIQSVPVFLVQVRCVCVLVQCPPGVVHTGQTINAGCAVRTRPRTHNTRAP